MNTNIEIKAKIKDIVKMRQKIEDIVGKKNTLLKQVDVFFCVPKGRLKLRSINGEKAQLIQYNRGNSKKPKPSNYFLYDVDDFEKMKTMLEMSIGVRGIVTKNRWLYLVDHTRIHVDEVENLGHFIELEVVLQEGQTQEEGEKIAHKWISDLGIQDFISCAYIDLLEESE